MNRMLDHKSLVLSCFQPGLVRFLAIALVSMGSLATAVLAAELPPEVPIDDHVRRGNGRIFLSLRLSDGTRVEAFADSGSPYTVLDESLAPKLGRKIGNKTLFFPAIGWADADVYDQPKLYLGRTQLVVDGNAKVTAFRKRDSKASDVRAIIGLNCLKHYCLQIDPIAGKVRFLNPDKLDKANLGEAIKLRLDWIHDKVYVAGNLAGNAEAESELDTGCPPDGVLEWRSFTHVVREGRANLFFKGQPPTFDPPPLASIREVDFHGRNYTNLVVGEMRSDNLIGLRFLARHVATINFPGRMLYLKRIDDSVAVNHTPTKPTDTDPWNVP